MHTQLLSDNLRLSPSPAGPHGLTPRSVTLSDVTPFLYTESCAAHKTMFTQIRVTVYELLLYFVPRAEDNRLLWKGSGGWHVYSPRCSASVKPADGESEWHRGPLGTKRGNTFSVGNCVVNHVVLRGFLLPSCQCHALSPNIRASIRL